jgi:hypothetical protein
MPITEEKALEILTELIRKPESKAEDIPRIWGELLNAFNTTFAPPVEEPKKKRRKRRVAGVLSPNLGWPQGVSRAEYKMWKEAQLARGVTEGLNPQEYKRLKDAGNVQPAKAAAPAAKAEAAKAAPKKAKK